MTTLAPPQPARAPGPADPRPVRLTRRDLDIIAGYARGRTVADTARALDTTEGVVKALTTRLAQRLGITGARQAALVHYAYCHGHLIVVRRRHLPPLTGRIADVLVCAARGLGCRATATELGISVETVRMHRQRLHRALGVHTTARAVAVAWEASLLSASSTTAPPTQKGTTP